ncbi:MAG: ABC transporter permease [Clostridium sp.]|uniref:ABC transporter permease n=1 Tax=Clostridium sp. TaxID=1506 RepID=UPI00306C1E6E
MYWHVFKYQLKCKFNDKEGLFWGLMFPIIFATFFNLAFSNIMSGESFEKINIALVNTSNMTEEFNTAITESNLFIIKNADESEAANLLSRGEIAGYITFEDEIHINVAKSGMNESMIKTFVDTFSQKISTLTNVVTKNSIYLTADVIENLSINKDYTDNETSMDSTNPLVIYFYSLLAMTSLLGANLGCTDVINIQANQSQRAARINVAPSNKIKVFLATISASLLLHFTNVLLVILYISQVLNVDFGNSLGFVILLSFVSCFTGITLGTMVSSLINKKASTKEAILLLIIMIGSFFSGMMSIDIKYIIQNKFPIMSYINPANLITDGFYSLYYYDTFNRYFLNLSILASFGIIFGVITYLVLRRQKYASI